MECAFSNIKIIPAYGYNICYIMWDINPIYKYGFFVNVYKSRDGYTDWYKLLNAKVDASTGLISDAYNEPVYLNRDPYAAVIDGRKLNESKIDLNLKPRNIIHNFHYKLELINSKNDIIDCTPAIGIYDTLDKSDFATLKIMIQNDILTDAGTDVFICRPKGMQGHTAIPSYHNLNDNVDPVTGDIVGGFTDNDSFGKYFSGGYSNPIKTRIVINAMKYETKDMQDGQGTVESELVAFSGISYPRLLKGDMIVNPKTDDRYLFENYSKEYFYKGNIPFKYEAVMKLLDRNDIAYKYNVLGLKQCVG